jgi:hypothetical protein
LGREEAAALLKLLDSNERYGFPDSKEALLRFEAAGVLDTIFKLQQSRAPRGNQVNKG